MNRALQFFEKDTAPDFDSNPDVTSFYETLTMLKHNRRELRAGAAAGFEAIDTGNKDVLMFRRTNPDAASSTIVCVNLGKADATVTLPSDVVTSRNIMASNISAANFMTAQDEASGSKNTDVTLAPGGYIVVPVDK